MKTRIISSVILLMGLALQVNGQELLKKEDAIAIALENNFDIQVAKNNLSVAENNADLLNSGYLPTLSGSADINKTTTNSTLVNQAAVEETRNGLESNRKNAGVNFNYTVFDGFGRKYSFEKLKENFQLNEVQARGVMENTMVNLFFSYYEIARLSENEINQKATLAISRERWQRAIYSFDYGQNSKLDVLNAEVDFNNDSINYLTIIQQLTNEKRNLNLLMGRDVGIDFQVDRSLIFTDDLVLSDLESEAKAKNTGLVQQEGQLRNTAYDIKIANASRIPQIGVNSSYAWSQNINPLGFFPEQSSTSLNFGATLSWSIFDGGKSNIQRQNAKLAHESQQIIVEQSLLDLERQLQNAWTSYQASLFVMQAQQKNQQTNELNFERSKEQYELGQISSITFRQAQSNLLNANLSYNQSKYSAKNAELELLKLSGVILEAKF